MKIIITDPAFIRPKTGLSFDVVITDIRVTDEGFEIEAKQRVKDTDGNVIEEFTRRETIVLKQENAQNLYNNVISNCTTKVKNKFTP